jgi:hypothetical protein
MCKQDVLLVFGGEDWLCAEKRSFFLLLLLIIIIIIKSCYRSNITYTEQNRKENKIIERIYFRTNFEVFM